MRIEDYACYNWVMVDYSAQDAGEKYTSLLHRSKRELVKFLTCFSR